MMEVMTWLKANINFPAIVLIVIFSVGGYILHQIQKKNENFDIADMLRDDNGKPSSSRLFAFAALGTSTWTLMYTVFQNQTVPEWMYIGYMCVWSGTKIVEKLVDVYFSRSSTGVPTPPAPVPTPSPPPPKSVVVDNPDKK